MEWKCRRNINSTFRVPYMSHEIQIQVPLSKPSNTWSFLSYPSELQQEVEATRVSPLKSETGRGVGEFDGTSEAHSTNASEGMCFYNQKRFSCGDWRWSSFTHRCNYEYRTGETCGMKLVNMAENENSKCRLCKKIETKFRRRSAEMDRLERWSREGTTLVASIDRSHNLIVQLDKEICLLQREREDRRRDCTRARKSVRRTLVLYSQD
jgi:hypothetical protein